MKECILAISLALLIASAAAVGNLKTVVGADLTDLGSIQPQGSNIKKVVGSGFEGLSGVSKVGEGYTKKITTVNFEQLGGSLQSEQDRGNHLIGKKKLPLPSNWTQNQSGQDQENSQIDENGQALPEMVDLSESTTVVFVGGSSIPLASYQTPFGKYLWIESAQGLSQYAAIPQYSGQSLIAYTSIGGQGEILEIYPSLSSQGVYQRIYFDFNPGYNRIAYRGDVAGRHHLLFTMNDQPSNSIIIDVIGNEAAENTPPVLGTMPDAGAM